MSTQPASLCISPSLAAGDLLALGEELAKLEASGCDMIHVDVMDGHFVPLLTLGVPFVAALKKRSRLPLDVHIMVANTDAVFEHYLDAGADVLSIHPESTRHPHRVLQRIRASGRKAGLALNPGSHWNQIEFLLPLADQVTIMSVNPGYSGQAHLPETRPKIAQLASFCRENGLKLSIQVDGGVSTQNVAELVRLGADNVVVGSALMGQPDYRKAVTALRVAAAAGIERA